MSKRKRLHRRPVRMASVEHEARSARREFRERIGWSLRLALSVLCMFAGPFATYALTLHVFASPLAAVVCAAFVFLVIVGLTSPV